MKSKRETHKHQSMLQKMNRVHEIEWRHHYWKTIVQVVKEILERPAGTGSSTQRDKP